MADKVKELSSVDGNGGNDSHESFVFFCEWWDEGMKTLSTDSKCKVMGALMRYVKNSLLPEDLDEKEEIAFNFIRNDIDRNFAKYEKISRARKEAGRKGGLSKAQNQKAKDDNDAGKNKQSVAKLAKLSNNDNDNVNDNDTLIDESTPPNIPQRGTGGDKELFQKLFYDGYYVYGDEIRNPEKYNLEGFVQILLDYFHLEHRMVIYLTETWQYGRLDTEIWKLISDIQNASGIKDPRAFFLKSLKNLTP